jgi:hypothetical protein
MSLTLQTGQSGTLTYQPAVAGIDAARVTNQRWAPVGQDQTKIKWTTPAQVEGIAVGQRTFRVEITLTAPVPTDPAEKVTYEFIVTCVPPVSTGSAPATVPITINFIITPPAGG